MAALHTALIVAVLALPAIGMAAWFARDRRPASPGMALHMAIVGIIMLLAALAIYFVDGNTELMSWIVIALLLLVNLVVVSLLLHLRRLRKQGMRR
ncbi:hypothetical protein CO614_05840 [Lysobacteraceae bacterium NML120232]|nr:hypothetical protein CO614_05840 [Xanthomonadaceae bacterium NML120232]